MTTSASALPTQSVAVRPSATGLPLLPLLAVATVLTLVSTWGMYGLLSLASFPHLRIAPILLWAALNWFLYLGFFPLVRLLNSGSASVFHQSTLLQKLPRQIAFALSAILPHSAIVLTLTLISVSPSHPMAWLGHSQGSLPFLLISQILLDTVVYGAVLAWDLLNRMQTQRIEAIQTQAQLTAKRLLFLRAQLQPHFLFNVLQSIMALQVVNLDAAQRMIVLLGDFLRSALRFPYDEVITVEAELGYLRCYVAIEEVRFQNRLRVNFHLAHDVLGAQVPPLIMQPLVENAIRYAVAPFDKIGTIAVTVEHTRDQLVMQVSDDGPGITKSPNGSSPSGGSGIGLANIKARLQEMYQDACDLVVETGPDGGAVARITIPFQLATEWHQSARELLNDNAVKDHSHTRR
jgi:two-component system LytT family sensor kinase